MESFLATLQRCGFRDVAAVKAYQIFSSYLLGALLLEVSHRGVDIGPVTEVDVDAPPATDLAEYPTLKKLQQEMSQERGAEIFAESLEVLIDHLEHLGKK